MHDLLQDVQTMFFHVLKVAEPRFFCIKKLMENKYEVSTMQISHHGSIVTLQWLAASGSSHQEKRSLQKKKSISHDWLKPCSH